MKIRRAMNICTGEVIEYKCSRAQFKRAVKLLGLDGWGSWRRWYTDCGYTKRPCKIVFKAVKKGL